jgi:hypothetical protein
MSAELRKGGLKAPLNWYKSRVHGISAEDDKGTYKTVLTSTMNKRPHSLDCRHSQETVGHHPASLLWRGSQGLCLST